MRGGIPISRMNGTYGSEIDSRQKRIESIDWNRFAQDLNQETAVSKARKREAQSLIDQINAIVGTKKESSAEEKLNSYKERTGLAQFQRTAQTQNLEIPQHLQNKIIQFLKNRIETFKGHISLLSLQEELLKVFSKEGLQKSEIDNPSFAKFISDMILEEQAKTPKVQMDSNLGKTYTPTDDNDPENTDFFHAMMVAKGSKNEPIKNCDRCNTRLRGDKDQNLVKGKFLCKYCYDDFMELLILTTNIPCICSHSYNDHYPRFAGWSYENGTKCKILLDNDQPCPCKEYTHR
jgi:hypothetical protein